MEIIREWGSKQEGWICPATKRWLMMRTNIICTSNISRKRSRQQVPVCKISSRHSNNPVLQNCTRMHAMILHSFVIDVLKIFLCHKNATELQLAATSVLHKNHLHLKCAKLSLNGSLRWVRIHFLTVLFVSISILYFFDDLTDF